MKQIKFPQDFDKTIHKVVPGAFQWLPKQDHGIFISIVGGGIGLYGDGVKTFEIMIEDDVQGFLSEQEINEVLAKTATPSPLPETAKTVKVKDGGTFPINDVETHILCDGQWRDIQDDQDGEFYFLLNGKAVYIEYPNQIHETGVTKSVEWFMALPVSKRIELANKYFPEYKHDGTDLEDSEIHQVYLKETGTPLTPGNERPTGEGFTPGPWEVRGNKIFAGKGYNCICTVSIQKAWDNQAKPVIDFEAEANARLIASAPDMLRALVGLYNYAILQKGESLHLDKVLKDAETLINSITGGK